MNEVARCIFLPHFFDEGARTRWPMHGVVTVAPFRAASLFRPFPLRLCWPLPPSALALLLLRLLPLPARPF